MEQISDKEPFMRYCPSCLAEYRADVVECADCGAPLLEGSPPERSQAELPDLDLVRLCQIHVGEADIIRAALAEAGIRSTVQEHGPITARLTRLSDGATEDYAIVYVTSNRLEAARRVLDAIRSAQVEWPEGMEPD